jgi:hypothetical protein
MIQYGWLEVVEEQILHGGPIPLGKSRHSRHLFGKSGT